MIYERQKLLPMRDFLHNSTPPTSPDEGILRGPRPETLQFLRAFARSYDPAMGEFPVGKQHIRAAQAALC